MSDKKKIEIDELNILINKGVNIEVERTIFVRKKGVLGYIQKRIAKKEKLQFTIQEPTLSVLDRLSAEQIELSIDEKEMSTDNAISVAKKYVNDHARRMARIVAIAVLGQDYIISIQQGSQVRYKNDDARLDELTVLFFNSIQPSRLIQYVIMINAMSNLGDFMNSIRLMSGNRTTMPILIEGNNKV